MRVGCSTSPSGVHPRVCGEAGCQDRRASRPSGPSPRVRGSLPDIPSQSDPLGSIPACAGKPTTRNISVRAIRVHPRVCGEALLVVWLTVLYSGPSPRVRGSRPTAVRGGCGQGSIPACAGKPASDRRVPRCSRVHPRVCGEARRPARAARLHRGPSPRVRGSLPPRSTAGRREGSIPACAGKPDHGKRRRDRLRVHPRVCGEASSEQTALVALPGPSPRVRGSRISIITSQSLPWSIPACAGKPAPKRRK